MPTSYTTNLRLSNPGLGDTGWGTTVSDGMISLVDPAIAGTTTLSTDADVTLTTANGATDQARQMILNCTGSRAAQRTITAPASSKVYVVINGTTGGFGVKLVGVGPTTGVVVPAGRMAVVAWNGSDFVTLGAVVDLTASGNVTVAGTTTLAALNASGNVSFDGGTFVFNDSGADKDARFEGDTDANLLFLDASTDRVGIGTATPVGKIDSVSNATAAFVARASTTGANQTVDALTAFNSDASLYALARYNAVQHIWRYAGTTEGMRLDASGNLGIGTTSPSYKLTVSGSSPDIVAANTGANGTRIAITASNTAAYVSTTYSGSGIPLIFNTAGIGAAGSTQMILDASGNVGIGTATPAAKLDVNGAASVRGFLTSTDAIKLGGNTSAPSTTDAFIYRPADNTLAFGTASNERARITSAGQFLVGTTSASSTSGIGVKINPDAAAPSVATVGSDTTSTNASYYLYSTGAAAYRFYVGYNGTVFATSTTITAISDGRLKENIRDLDAGLSEVMALKPRRFDWKPGKGKDKKNDLGWIAQEFERVFPDMIQAWKDPAHEGEEPYKAVNADLIPVLVKAVQEQQALITNLIERVRALEAA